MQRGAWWAAGLSSAFLGAFLLAAWQLPSWDAPARRLLLQLEAVEDQSSAWLGAQREQPGGAEEGSAPASLLQDPSLPRIAPSVPLAYVASPKLPRLRRARGVSDPSVAFFKGHYVIAFTERDTSRVHFSASRDGVQWKLSDRVLLGMSWVSLFVHAGQLYLIGPEGVLWFRKQTTNDLLLVRLDFDPDTLQVREAGRARLTRGMGVHILNNVPLVANDTVFFPFMVAPASTRWDPIPIERFVAANASALEQGKHAMEASAGEVRLQGLDWDAGVFGVTVGRHVLGRNAFVRLEEGGGEGNVTIYARVVGVEGSVLWLMPERWHAECSGEDKGWACKDSVTRAGGGAALTTAASLVPDSPLYQEFLLSVLQSAPGAANLLDPAAWSMAPLVGNPVMRYPQAHKLWAGPSVQERTVEGRTRQCTGTGFWECVYWQEPVAFASRDGADVRIAVRLTNDQNCNSALLCTLTDGELDCEDFGAVPGFGNVRGYVFFDNATSLYWTLNNFNLDTTVKETGKGFRRAGQRCIDSRGNLGLFYSGDAHNWVLAKVVAKANGNRLSLQYVSCTVREGELFCTGKTNGRLNFTSGCLEGPAANHHSSALIVAFRIPNFRSLVH